MQDGFDIETENLVFYCPGLDDFEDSAVMWANPETTRFIGGTPSSPEESWARLLRNVGHWQLTGYGFWVVRDKQSGRFVGEVGLKQFRRGLDPAFEQLPEIGWVLKPGNGGRGLATEAAQAALAWGDARFRWKLTLCIIDPENAASIRVAVKCGYKENSRTEYRDKPVIIFGRTAKP